MTVAVIGGSGLVGSPIVEALKAGGHTVVVFSRHGQVVADITSRDFPKQFAAALPACDAIVHCAACMSKNLVDPEISLVNALGTQHVIAAAQRTGATQLIYLSSVPVIGEPRLLPIGEDHPTAPKTAYHASKLFGEHLARLAGDAQSKLRTTSLRITSPIGPGTPRGRIFTEFVARARAGQPLSLAGEGLRRQNYVDVRDIAHAVCLCLQHRTSGLYNIAGATAISNLELAQLCVRVLRSTSQIVLSGKPDPEEHLHWDISIKKAASDFGYRPQYPLEASISDWAP